MKLNPIKVILFLLLCAYATVSLSAQETFIKRYKNSTLSESGVAVCELPNKQIAIVGQQANGFSWQAPIIIITDSTGNQLHHKMDTFCMFCDPSDAASDSLGNIYVVGDFFGKAGIAKYDVSGLRTWIKSYATNDFYSTFRSVLLVNDTLILAGGVEAVDDFGGGLLLVYFNSQGDTIRKFRLGYGTTMSVDDLNQDSSHVYVTGLITDSLPPFSQKVYYMRISKRNYVFDFSLLELGYKRGMAILPINSNEIVIGGASSNMNLNPYSFIAILDSMGNVNRIMEDSNMIYNYITKLVYNKSLGTLSVLNFDTIYENGLRKDLDKITSYNYPFNNLQEYVWEKTVTGTYNPTSYRDLKLMQDGTLLHTGYASTNCPQCPYLLKADDNTCADLACDTAFVSGLFLPDEENTPNVNLTLKLFPNPMVGEYLYFELHSDQPIKIVSTSCTDVAGKVVTFVPEGEFIGKEFYRGRIAIPAGLPRGMYIFRVSADQKYVLKGKFTKAD